MSEPTAQMPMSARSTPASAVAVERLEERGEHRQRDDLGGNEESERREALAEPDGAAVARREDEPVEHAMLVLRDPGPREPEQRGEDDRDPEQPVRGAGPRLLGKCEVEDDERRQDEEEHGWQRVPPPELDPQVLPRQSGDVGEVRHPSATVVVARGAMRSGSCVETTSVRSAASASSSRSRSAAPLSSSAE